MPIIILVWLLCGILRNRVWMLISGAAVLVAIIIAENATSAWQRSRVLNPAFVEVAEALERLLADLTLAEYWSTTPTYIASGRQLMVCPIRAEAFLHMIANYGWCAEGLDRWARRHNWLVIAMNERLDRDAIVTAYGLPDRELALQNHQLWLYSWSVERQANHSRVICQPVKSFRHTPPC